MLEDTCSSKVSNNVSDSASTTESSVKPFNSEDQSYFHLMEIVGSSGKYQTLILVLWCVIWFIAGQLLLGTPFLLYNAPYENCPENVNETCSEYVCKLPEKSRYKYLDQSFTSLATQFDDYHCENSFKIQLAQTQVYLGSLVGYLVVSWMNDNLGRRKSILIGLFVSLAGIIMIASSISLSMAQVGLFLAGFGIDPSINTVFYFISQTIQNNQRQKHCTIIQFFFSLAGMVNVFNYLFLKNWRLIFWLFFVIPTIIAVFLVYWFVQETPQFMIMFYSAEETVQALKRIAAINESPFFVVSGNQQLLYAHVQKLKSSYENKKQSSHKKYFNFWDIFRYPSIRTISIHVCFLSFSIYLMYYGPLMLIEKYNLNVFVSALVVTASDIITYPIVYFWVDKMKRKLWAKILFGVAVVCSILLFFIMGKNEGLLKFIQMVLIFIFRFAISFEFVVFAIYCTQLFPAQIKGLAIGFASALGTVASSSSPIILGQLQKTSFPVMLIFVLFGGLSFISSFYLPETLNQKLQENLAEFGEDFDEKKSQKATFAGNRKQLELVEQLGEDDINSKYSYKQKIFQ